MRRVVHNFNAGEGRFNPVNDLDVIALLQKWGKWSRIGNGSKLGYARRTMEGRLQDGELVGIKGAGEYKPPSDLLSEGVEQAVSRMAERHRLMALALRGRFSRRLSREEVAVELSREAGRTVSVGNVKRLEDMAIAWVDCEIDGGQRLPGHSG